MVLRPPFGRQAWIPFDHTVTEAGNAVDERELGTAPAAGEAG